MSIHVYEKFIFIIYNMNTVYYVYINTVIRMLVCLYISAHISQGSQFGLKQWHHCRKKDWSYLPKKKKIGD